MKGIQAMRAVRTFATSKATKNDNTIQSAFSNLKKQHDKLEMQQQNQKKAKVASSLVNNFVQQTTYDPFDFSIAKLRYDKKVKSESYNRVLEQSAFNSAEVNPKDYYVMPHMLSKFMNSTGQIQPHSVTGLKPNKQKAMAKAVRRSRAFGLVSSVSKDVAEFPKRGSSL